MTTIRVIDTETTGLTAEDKLVEIAVVYVDADTRSIVDCDYDLVNPGMPIPPEAMAVHHITDAEVQTAFDHMTAMHIYSGGEIYCAHHCSFDQQFLHYDADWICTYKVASRVWPEAPAHKNQVLRYWRNLTIDPRGLALPPHRALHDAMVTAALLIDLLQHMSVAEMIECTKLPVILTKVGFGKHAGKRWSEVPVDYLKWMLGTDMDEDCIATAKHWIERHRQQ